MVQGSDGDSVKQSFTAAGADGVPFLGEIWAATQVLPEHIHHQGTQMTTLNPKSIAPKWEQESWSCRARAAVLLLSVHGFITQKQSQAAYERISEWEKKAETEQALQDGIRSREKGWG